MQMGRIKEIKGCWVMMTKIRKNNCVYTLEEKVINLVYKNMEVQNQFDSSKLGSKQVGFKLGHKQVGFKKLGPSGVHGVHIDKRVWFEVELQGSQENRKVVVFLMMIAVMAQDRTGREESESRWTKGALRNPGPLSLIIDDKGCSLVLMEEILISVVLLYLHSNDINGIPLIGCKLEGMENVPPPNGAWTEYTCPGV
ncbi:hypothetical protein Tco_0516953 [Tanacetum coccineum]